jgi:hypothetical protein
VPHSLDRIHQLHAQRAQPALARRLARAAPADHARRTAPIPANGPARGVAIELLDQLLTTLAAVTGTTFDNMVRGHAWMFLDMGPARRTRRH